jgi:hypothetical protein
MGLVIRFPLEQRIAQDPGPAARPGELATVVILPVVRIDRHAGASSDGLAPGTGPGRGRRRRVVPVVNS